ncbi:mucin-2-like [Ambystoma mexicanum]|uniref:mucin-2-like n=1 Tax=Ambystoma mexicanum TaxID=8296 RepID=UPI0037E85BB6
MHMKALLGLVLVLNCLGVTHQQYASSSSFCNMIRATFTPKKEGYGICVCQLGYMGDGYTCSPQSSCGSTKCCGPGFTWDGNKRMCVNVNECADPTLNKCVPKGACLDFNGGYLCKQDRSAACDSAPCGADQDCVLVNGVPQCADPCLDYQELSGPSRLSSTVSKGRFLSDRYLVGWYRFVGSMGVQMKEGCLGGGLKCGSAEPFTLLEGSHPTLGTGIQLAPLLMNKVPSSPAVASCPKVGSILVKACPAPPSKSSHNGFYIYKFSGSINAEVYCTDPSRTSLNPLPTTPAPTTTPVPTTTTTTTTEPTTTTPIKTTLSAPLTIATTQVATTITSISSTTTTTRPMTTTAKLLPMTSTKPVPTTITLSTTTTTMAPVAAATSQVPPTTTIPLPPKTPTTPVSTTTTPLRTASIATTITTPVPISTTQPSSSTTLVPETTTTPVLTTKSTSAPMPTTNAKEPVPILTITTRMLLTTTTTMQTTPVPTTTIPVPTTPSTTLAPMPTINTKSLAPTPVLITSTTPIPTETTTFLVVAEITTQTAVKTTPIPKLTTLTPIQTTMTQPPTTPTSIVSTIDKPTSPPITQIPIRPTPVPTTTTMTPVPTEITNPGVTTTSITQSPATELTPQSELISTAAPPLALTTEATSSDTSAHENMIEESAISMVNQQENNGKLQTREQEVSTLRTTIDPLSADNIETSREGFSEGYGEGSVAIILFSMATTTTKPVSTATIKETSLDTSAHEHMTEEPAISMANQQENNGEPKTRGEEVPTLWPTMEPMSANNTESSEEGIWEGSGEVSEAISLFPMSTTSIKPVSTSTIKATSSDTSSHEHMTEEPAISMVNHQENNGKPETREEEVPTLRPTIEPTSVNNTEGSLEGSGEDSGAISLLPMSTASIKPVSTSTIKATSSDTSASEPMTEEPAISMVNQQENNGEPKTRGEEVSTLRATMETMFAHNTESSGEGFLEGSGEESGAISLLPMPTTTTMPVSTSPTKATSSDTSSREHMTEEPAISMVNQQENNGEPKTRGEEVSTLRATMEPMSAHNTESSGEGFLEGSGEESGAISLLPMPTTTTMPVSTSPTKATSSDTSSREHMTEEPAISMVNQQENNGEPKTRGEEVPTLWPTMEPMSANNTESSEEGIWEGSGEVSEAISLFPMSTTSIKPVSTSTIKATSSDTSSHEHMTEEPAISMVNHQENNGKPETREEEVPTLQPTIEPMSVNNTEGSLEGSGEDSGAISLLPMSTASIKPVSTSTIKATSSDTSASEPMTEEPAISMVNQQENNGKPETREEEVSTLGATMEPMSAHNTESSGEGFLEGSGEESGAISLFPMPTTTTMPVSTSPTKATSSDTSSREHMTEEPAISMVNQQENNGEPKTRGEEVSTLRATMEPMSAHNTESSGEGFLEGSGEESGAISLLPMPTTTTMPVSTSPTKATSSDTSSREHMTEEPAISMVNQQENNGEPKTRGEEVPTLWPTMEPMSANNTESSEEGIWEGSGEVSEAISLFPLSTTSIKPVSTSTIKATSSDTSSHEHMTEEPAISMVNHQENNGKPETREEEVPTLRPTIEPMSVNNTEGSLEGSGEDSGAISLLPMSTASIKPVSTSTIKATSSDTSASEPMTEEPAISMVNQQENNGKPETREEEVSTLGATMEPMSAHNTESSGEGFLEGSGEESGAISLLPMPTTTTMPVSTSPTKATSSDTSSREHMTEEPAISMVNQQENNGEPKTRGEEVSKLRATMEPMSAHNTESSEEGIWEGSGEVYGAISLFPMSTASIKPVSTSTIKATSSDTSASEHMTEEPAISMVNQQENNGKPETREEEVSTLRNTIEPMSANNTEGSLEGSGEDSGAISLLPMSTASIKPVSTSTIKATSSDTSASEPMTEEPAISMVNQQENNGEPKTREEEVSTLRTTIEPMSANNTDGSEEGLLEGSGDVSGAISLFPMSTASIKPVSTSTIKATSSDTSAGEHMTEEPAISMVNQQENNGKPETREEEVSALRSTIAPMTATDADNSLEASGEDSGAISLLPMPTTTTMQVSTSPTKATSSDTSASEPMTEEPAISMVNQQENNGKPKTREEEVPTLQTTIDPLSANNTESSGEGFLEGSGEVSFDS